MTVFKTFLKVLKSCKTSIIIYTVLLIIFGGLNMQTSETSTSFVSTKPDILIINNDENKGITKDLINYVKNNSNIINISNDRVDINKREKIRKAAEIVIDNIDYFSEGKFDKVKNPNKEEVSEEDKNADNTTKSNPV